MEFEGWKRLSRLPRGRRKHRLPLTGASTAVPAPACTLLAQRSLFTSTCKDQADEVSVEFRKAPTPTRQVKRTDSTVQVGGDADPAIRELFDIYGTGETPEKGPGKRKHDRACKEMFLRVFRGGRRKASSLSEPDVKLFIRERRRGVIAPRGARKQADGKLKGVGDRQIQYDLQHLLAVLNWAPRNKDDPERFFLATNPLAGVELPDGDADPKQPVLTEEWCQDLLAVAPQIGWRFEVALVVVHESMHRGVQVRRLRVRDIDSEDRCIWWRGQSKRKQFSHVTPMTAVMEQALKRAVRESGAIGDQLVLPADRDSTKEIDRGVFKNWRRKAWELAGLSKVPGTGRHSPRRKGATETTEDIETLMRRGGWKYPASPPRPAPRVAHPTSSRRGTRVHASRAALRREGAPAGASDAERPAAPAFCCS